MRHTLCQYRGLQICSMQTHSTDAAHATQGALLPSGAGDLFASGFLAAWLAGRPLQDCARLGCLAGAAVLQARPPSQHCGWHKPTGHHVAARTCACVSTGTRSASYAGASCAAAAGLFSGCSEDYAPQLTGACVRHAVLLPHTYLFALLAGGRRRDDGGRLAVAGSAARRTGALLLAFAKSFSLHVQCSRHVQGEGP